MRNKRKFNTFKESKSFCEATRCSMSKVATRGLILILSAIIMYHFMIIFQMVPADLVSSSVYMYDTDMYMIEGSSILMNIFFIFIVMVKTKILHINIPEKIVNGILWLMVVMFTLNTVGNILFGNDSIKFVFTPITFILGYLSFVLILEKDEETDSIREEFKEEVTIQE